MLLDLRSLPLTALVFRPAESDMKPETLDAEPKGPTQAFDPSSDDDQELPRLTSTTERRLMAKIDWHILPCLCVLYLLAFLDRYEQCALQPMFLRRAC